MNDELKTEAEVPGAEATAANHCNDSTPEATEEVVAESESTPETNQGGDTNEEQTATDDVASTEDSTPEATEETQQV